jgi:Immunity protein Imm1
MELRVNQGVYEVSEPGPLQTYLSQVRGTPFAEVWLQPASRWPTICALINGEAALMMFLRWDGDAGFSTRNANYAGPAKGVVEYYLSNGQREEFPASWNITTSEALRAIEYFLAEEKMAPWLLWHEERP